MAGGWGPGTWGEEANTPQAAPSPSISPSQFTPDKSAGSDLSVHEHANRVNRVVSSYLASSPEQRHQGNTWYSKAHRAAVTVANGEAPGVGAYTPAMKRGVYRKPGVTDEHVERAAGAIARLSPSMPAGMDWENNSQAAHEVGKLSDKQVTDISRSKPGARNVRGNVSMHHAGEHAIVHAHAILKGDVTAEQDLNQKVGSKGFLEARAKIGSFKRNLVDPAHSPEVTVDARQAGVTAGKRLGFQDVAPQIGTLKGQRYKDYEAANQEATGIINQHLARTGSAGRTPLKPHQVQATTWLADKSDLETKMGNAGGGRARGAHLHAGAGGKALSRLDFPTPVGQERTSSA